MPDIQVFSDPSCSNEIPATYVAESGHHSEQPDGSAAFDDISGTKWRPQCAACNAMSAWVTFLTSSQAHCVKANNLGKGAGGTAEPWNGEIVVDVHNSEQNQWIPAMKSDSGNIATSKKGIRAKLIFQRFAI